jgi:hypothetical protein
MARVGADDFRVQLAGAEGRVNRRHPAPSQQSGKFNTAAGQGAQH